MRPTDSRRGLYRSRNRIIGGVCGGIAEYFDFSTFWVRFGAVMLLFMTGFWPTVVAYFIAALIMKPAPAKPIYNEDEKLFYDSYMRSPRHTTETLKHRFEQLDRRIRRMEDLVTRRSYEWEQRFNQS
jgi:phage shock protein C